MLPNKGLLWKRPLTAETIEKRGKGGLFEGSRTGAWAVEAIRVGFRVLDVGPGGEMHWVMNGAGVVVAQKKFRFGSVADQKALLRVRSVQGLDAWCWIEGHYGRET